MSYTQHYQSVNMVKNLAVQRMTNGGVGIGDNNGGVEEPVGAEDSLLLRRGLINGKTKAVKTVAGVDDHNKALDDDRYKTNFISGWFEYLV